MTTIESYSFYNCNNLATINIPNSVTSIEEYAFSLCFSLTNVTLPNSLTTIGERAFENCRALTTLAIPNSVTVINSGTFILCTSLTSVTIPNSITNIEYNAFWDCSNLTNITIPNSVTNIGEGAFRDCTGLTDVTIPNSVTMIDKQAFSGCSNLVSIHIGKSVNTIAYDAFDGCNLTSVYLEDLEAYCRIKNPCALCNGADLYVGGTKLEELYIPANIEEINEHFRGCQSIKNLTTPTSLRIIGGYAFTECPNLLTVNLSAGTERLEERCFSDCPKLIEVNSYAVIPPTCSDDTFFNSYPNILLYMCHRGLKMCMPLLMFGKISPSLMTCLRQV